LLESFVSEIRAGVTRAVHRRRSEDR
jgi:hypothetical protein